MAKLGQDVTFHTVKGDCAAKVIGKGHNPGGNPDDDTQLVVWGSDETAGAETGLRPGENLRWSHKDTQAGGYS